MFEFNNLDFPYRVATPYNFFVDNFSRRIKALVLRQDSDWCGDWFGELRLPQYIFYCGALLPLAAIEERRNRREIAVIKNYVFAIEKPQ